MKPRSPLASLSPTTRSALNAAVGTWLPAESLALYARWWQLETWLRQLAYVELRALHGTAWEKVVRAARGRQSEDAQYSHMAAEDSENPLAYLDYSQLRVVIEDNWTQFEPTLIRRSAWEGRQDELARIRHRIGHVRRAHRDDLGRLEQTLRDLERGAFIAFASYNDRRRPEEGKHTDAVTLGWLGRQHPTARRLINHAEDAYDTRLMLRFSRRPWASWPDELARGTGVLWHVEFIMRDRYVDLRRLWYDSYLTNFRSLIVHLVGVHPRRIGFTFAAIDDDEAIADAIGLAFDAVLTVGHWGYPAERAEQEWKRRASATDYRVVHGTGWDIVDETTVPISSFGAGGGVLATPSW